MKKVLFFAVALMVFSPLVTLAADPADATVFTANIQSSPATIASDTFDNLVLDMSVTAPVYDTLDTLTVKNLGNARGDLEIKNLVLWLDNYNDHFDGYEGDFKLGTGGYDAELDVWVFDDLHEYISSLGERFFVTVETAAGGVDYHTYHFVVPIYSDRNDNGLYDPGDAGIFLSSYTPAPAGTLDSGITSLYRAATRDELPPVIYSTNLYEGDNVLGANFVIFGEVRDQGGSAVASVTVCLDGDCSVMTDLDYLPSWDFIWFGLADGPHTVYFQAADTAGNETQTEEINFTARVTPMVDARYSDFRTDKKEIIADGLDFALLSAEVKDQLGSLTAGQKVDLVFNNEAIIVDKKSGLTDANGKVNFVVRARKETNVKFYLQVNGQNYYAPLELNFLPEEALVTTDYTKGNWIKAAGNPTVYFLDQDNVRHPYPTQAVWESYFQPDFSLVKVVSEAVMSGYALGRNVPFRAGTLVKIPSVNKVYKVDIDNSLRWLKTEAEAKLLYGEGWARRVKDLPEAFFFDYTVNSPIDFLSPPAENDF
jgi:hypothetical protein